MSRTLIRDLAVPNLPPGHYWLITLMEAGGGPLMSLAPKRTLFGRQKPVIHISSTEPADMPGDVRLRDWGKTQGVADALEAFGVVEFTSDAPCEGNGFTRQVRWDETGHRTSKHSSLTQVRAG